VNTCWQLECPDLFVIRLNKPAVSPLTPCKKPTFHVEKYQVRCSPSAYELPHPPDYLKEKQTNTTHDDLQDNKVSLLQATLSTSPCIRKHLHTIHLDIVLSLNATADVASCTARPTCVRDELENMTDSDYQSDPGLEIADIHPTSGEIDDMHNDSDTEDVSHPPVRARPLGQETIPAAGRPLGEVAGYTELNKDMTDHPWSPFSSEDDFNLASWFVQSKVAKSQIIAYFAQGLGGTDSRSFRSDYSFRQHLNVLDPSREYLLWAEASIHDGRHATTFYYRNIIDCVRYPIRQVAYSWDIVDAPIREYDLSGERSYSEMHRTD